MGSSCSPLASPSMVVTLLPSQVIASVRQLLMRRPSSSTVHAPHCPWSHPFFVPVRCISARSRSSSDMRGSTCTCFCSPLIETLSASCLTFASCASPWARLPRDSADVPSSAPAPATNSRRENDQSHFAIVSSSVLPQKYSLSAIPLLKSTAAQQCLDKARPAANPKLGCAK